MSDASETERLKARVADLEAKQAAPSGVGGVLSIVQAVVGLVPRWLVVAAGVIAVTFIGAEAYFKIRAQWAETRRIETQSSVLTARPIPLPGYERHETERSPSATASPPPEKAQGQMPEDLDLPTSLLEVAMIVTPIAVVIGMLGRWRGVVPYFCAVQGSVLVVVPAIHWWVEMYGNLLLAFAVVSAVWLGLLFGIERLIMARKQGEAVSWQKPTKPNA